MKNFEIEKNSKRGAEKKSLRVVFFALLCIACFSVNAFSQAKKPVAKKPAAKAPAAKPAAELPKVPQIDDIKFKEVIKANGKPLLINFWATWCGPCREEFPDLVKIDKDYGDKIDFITFSLDFVEDAAEVPKFLNTMKAEMPTYLLVSQDESLLINSISKDWSGALPFTILLNEKGEAVYSYQGKVKIEMLRSKIDSLIKPEQTAQ